MRLTTIFVACIKCFWAGLRGNLRQGAATHLTGDLKGEEARLPEGTLLTLLRGGWETRGILSWGRGVVATRMRLSSMD